MLVDELQMRRQAKARVLRAVNGVRVPEEQRIPRDPLKPIFHPDQHIIPALRNLDMALLVALKDSMRARALAWQAIKHAEICDMPNVIKYAKALLGVL